MFAGSVKLRLHSVFPVRYVWKLANETVKCGSCCKSGFMPTSEFPDSIPKRQSYSARNERRFFHASVRGDRFRSKFRITALQNGLETVEARLGKAIESVCRQHLSLNRK